MTSGAKICGAKTKYGGIGNSSSITISLIVA